MGQDDIELLKTKKLLVGVTGSIAVLGIPGYLGMFRTFFQEVKVIMTAAAQQLIPAPTLGLFCDEMFTGSELTTERKMGHVELARWADLLIIIPASANVLGSIANGLANNLLTTTVLAHQYPVLLFPNMNASMWEKNALQRNISQIRKDGHKIIDPNHTVAYEIASGTPKSNFILPSMQETLQHLLLELKSRNDS